MFEKETYDLLIVDDIAENIKVLANILTHSNYNVRKALSGKVALRSIKSSPPDLILLDIKMPEMDGYQVCQILKEDPETKSIPIIFISALNEVFDKVKAFQMGAVDYITKPFQIEEVIARINNQLTIQKQKKLLQQEIEKRKETEEILYQSRALLASILNTSLDGIVALQAVRKPLSTHIDDFRCLVVNPVFAKIINRHRDDLVGKLVGKKIMSKIDPNLFSKLVDVVDNGGVLAEDICFKQNNQSRWYHYIATKLGDGFSVTIRDITRRKKMELQLESLAKIDALTAIANRRQFDEIIAHEWQRHQRQQQPLTLIIADVDNFKAYNDNYGHPQGDECLYQIAQGISRTVKRAGELVARYGGEEFAIILPNTSPQKAVNLAKLIRKNIRELQIIHEYSPTNEVITLSLGIVTMIPSLNSGYERMINIADKALYQAKNSGKNKIVIAKPELM
ncbi:diguanylate cyclase [Cyanobacterium aponinum FACHB-4101]|uniref:diguanylate cyclase domain-containing protein n=1 Tax=Cyanobacterium aponinum TaxID=379064 RepID=UPI00167FF18B|nr:diguanylate cyclase [Cyanobacterium aponinum]MBD2394287.1 diguanylate cyclase [Cyanobacterium aponinum FACHB-4101]